MHAVQRVHDLVREGRISAHDGAMLLELRRQIAWRRLPWWVRWLDILMAAVSRGDDSLAALPEW